MRSLKAEPTVVFTEPTVVVQPESRAAPQANWQQLAARSAVVVCLIFGVCGRIAVYTRNQSLWIDEAMLALNVVHRTPSELLKPLDLNQGAPIGFLLISKSVIANFGSSELALRAIPLLASIVGLVLFVSFAYRSLQLSSARLAVVLFSLSPYLIGYAAEFKQYGLDATIAVGLVTLAGSVWNGTSTRSTHISLACAGAVAVWFSHPAVFVLAGIGSVLFLDAFSNQSWPRFRRNGYIVGAWVTSFALCYWFFLRKLGVNQYLLDYWAGTFLPMPPVKPGDLAWVVHHFFLLFEKPGGFGGEFGLAGFAGVCFLVGALALAKHDWRLVAALLLPLLFAMIASGFRKYPFAGRLMLFVVPLLIPLVAAGAIAMAERLRDLGSFAWWLIVGAVCLGSVGECNTLRKSPLHSEDTRELIGELWQQWQPGDRVYVYYGAVPAFAYYHLRYPFPREAVTFGVENRGKDQRQFQIEIESLRGHSRVWVVLAHRQVKDEVAIRAYLDSLGAGGVAATLRDAVLMRYDLTRK
jgi:hypothetical protein